MNNENAFRPYKAEGIQSVKDPRFSATENRGSLTGKTHAGQMSGVCQLGLAYMMMQFLGQASAQVPQATHLSSSRVQVLAARSTVRAPAGHFLAQRVQ